MALDRCWGGIMRVQCVPGAKVCEYKWMLQACGRSNGLVKAALGNSLFGVSVGLCGKTNGTPRIWIGSQWQWVIEECYGHVAALDYTLSLTLARRPVYVRVTYQCLAHVCDKAGYVVNTLEWRIIFVCGGGLGCLRDRDAMLVSGIPCPPLLHM